MTGHGLTVEEIPRRDVLADANRANDRQAIFRFGPFAAIMRSPTEGTATRRAALVLAMHRWLPGQVRVRPGDVVAALGTWRLLHGKS